MEIKLIKFKLKIILQAFYKIGCFTKYIILFLLYDKYNWILLTLRWSLSKNYVENQVIDHLFINYGKWKIDYK